MDMNMLYIVAGVVVGLLVGYLMGASKAGKEKAAWDEQLNDAQDKLASLEKRSAGEVEKARLRAAKAEEQVAATGGELIKIKQQLGGHQKQMDQAQAALQEAQTSLQEVEAARARAVEAADAHKMARQQAEGRCRQAESMFAQAQQQIQEMGAQLEQLQSDKAALAQAQQRQSKELQRLRGEVASGRTSSSGLDESVEVFAGTDGSLEGILQVLLETEGLNTAVVADANGIIVAAAGEDDLKEGIAAATQVVRAATTQLTGMVPFDNLQSYVLRDADFNVISGRFFHCAGENVGLATYGPRHPNDRVLDGAMANLSAILG